MGFLSRLFGRAKPAPQTRSNNGWGPAFDAHSVTGVDVSPATALNATAFLAGVTMLCEDFAKLTPTLYRKDKDGARLPATDHELFALLYTPNDWQNYFEFAEMMQFWLVVRGNAYAVKKRNARGEVIALIPVAADWVALWEAPDGNLFYRVTPLGLHMMAELSGQPFLIPAEDVFHVRGFSMNGLLGVSRIVLAKEAIGLSIAIERQQAQWMGQGASVNGVLTTDQKLTADAAARMSQDWKDRKSGLQNAGKVLVLEQGLKWQATAMTAADAQLIASRGFQVAEIARLLRVPAHMIGDLTRCMPASTLVYTLDGPKRIVDVKEGDFVWSCDDTGIRASRVIGCYDNGEDEILEIKTTNRTVRCNPAHRLLARRAHEVAAAPGQTGDRNIGGRKMRVEWCTEYVAAQELEPGDALVALDRIPDLGGDTAPNGRALTEGFMEFCGLLLGDGNLIKANGKYVGVQIARADSARYMDHYRDVARKEFRAGGTTPTHGERHGMAKLSAAEVAEIRAAPYAYGVNVALASQYGVARATIKSVRTGRKWNEPRVASSRPILLVEGVRQTVFKSALAAQELFDLGFSGTAFTKRVPEWVHGLKEDLRLAFLRGFLDADGTANKRGRIAFDSANRELLDGFRHLCIGLGIPVTNMQSVTQTSTPPEATAPHTTVMHRFTCSNPAANARIGSHDPRYIERMAAGVPFGRKGRAYPRRGGKGFDLAGAALSAVVSIRKLAKERVFDLEIDGTHCFVADGLVVHNSTNNNIVQQAQEYINLTLSSYTTRWAWKLDTAFDLRRQGIYLDYDMSSLTRADITQRYANYARGIMGGFLKPNEARLDDGRDPDPAGDKLLEPSNMSTMGSQSSGTGADGGGRPADGSPEQKI